MWHSYFDNSWVSRKQEGFIIEMCTFNKNLKINVVHHTKMWKIFNLAPL